MPQNSKKASLFQRTVLISSDSPLFCNVTTHPSKPHTKHIQKRHSPCGANRIRDVAEVVAVGQPDDKWGERVVCVLRMKAGRPPVELAALREWARPQMAPYKLPSVVHVVDAVPKVRTRSLCARCACSPRARARARGWAAVGG